MKLKDDVLLEEMYTQVLMKQRMLNEEANVEEAIENAQTELCVEEK